MEQKQARWIWVNETPIPDEYGEFAGDFHSEKGQVNLKISADTDYALYLNGELVGFGQYPCYPAHPVYDELEIPLKQKDNHLRIIVYYLGVEGFSTYKLGKAGLFFALTEEGRPLLVSDETILSRRSLVYEASHQQEISHQLGYSFFYDAREEENEEGWGVSKLVEKPIPEEKRPNQKTKLGKRVPVELLSGQDGRLLFDLRKETVGFLTLEFVSPVEQELVISYSEHLLEDGSLPRKIEYRDFSVVYHAKKGRNSYLNPFRRLGCRYLEIACKSPIKISYFGLTTVFYPFVKKAYSLVESLEQKIYDTCVYTLQCCYHDHYEDCPWREQSFYVLDSRNQMLAGYDAFQNQEQARASLRLIAQDERKDGLLSICYPSGFDLTIPSFSLNYFTAVREYYDHTQDLSLLREVYPKLQRLMASFIAQLRDGVVENFTSPSQWNFYEWSPSLDYLSKDTKSDVILNSFFLLALRHLSVIAQALGEENPYLPLYTKNRKAVREAFYDEEKGYFVMAKNDPKPSILGNSLGILAGLLTSEEAKKLCEKMLHERDSFVPLTLSMEGFFYDALLQSDPAYQAFIRSDIQKRYGKMLLEGATTFYETEEGWKAFNNAGSLCHGWSALPIHYYHLFGLGKEG
jgi:alpha-L-rhamnosidase